MKDYATTLKVAALVVLLSSCPFMGRTFPAPNSITRFQSRNQKEEIVFKQGSAGSGKTKDGSRFSFTEWESSDGVWLTFRTEKRGSLPRARAALLAALRGKSVLERRPKLDRRGQNVGERVVAKYYWKEGKKYQNIIVWTEGSDVNYLESSSLQHILAFEKSLVDENH